MIRLFAAIEGDNSLAGTHYGVEVECGATADFAAELVAWAQQQNLKRVEAYRPFVAPWLDEGLEQVKRGL